MGALQPGQLLDGTSYRVVREIGSGGMGVVYEIEHVRLRKRYVAKVISESIANEEGSLTRMEREAQVLAELNHPNVVQVHDVGTTASGVHYFVMEKLDGEDLRRFLQRGPVPWATAVRITIDVLDALDYVHRRGVVHRDIKPENIFLSQQPQGTQTKVLDFGVVHIFDRDGSISRARITKTGGFAGTLYYASPEQMQGKPPGPPNDVYAAGLVLFELLAGKGPFDDDPGVGLSRCFKPAPRLVDRIAIDPTLSDAVGRALEQEPTSRPTAGVLATELRTILDRHPGTARVPVPAGFKDSVAKEVDDLLQHMSRDPSPSVEKAIMPPIARMDAGAPPPTATLASAPLPNIAALSPSPRLPTQAPVLFAPSRPTSNRPKDDAPAPDIAPATTPPVRRENSSPAVYSTVNGGSALAPAIPTKSVGPMIAAAAIGFVVLAGSIGGVFIYRRGASPATATSVGGDAGVTPGVTPVGDASAASPESRPTTEPPSPSQHVPPRSSDSPSPSPPPPPPRPVAAGVSFAPATPPAPAPPPAAKPKPAQTGKDSMKDGYLREL